MSNEHRLARVSFSPRLKPGLGVRACEAPGRRNGVAPHRVDAAQAAGDLQATDALPTLPLVGLPGASGELGVCSAVLMRVCCVAAQSESEQPRRWVRCAHARMLRGGSK